MMPEITLSHLHYFIVNFAPIMIIMISVFDKLIKFPENAFLIFPVSTSIFTGLTLFAFYTGIPENIYFKFDWRYEVAFLYIIYFYLNWILFYFKTRSFKTSSIMATLSTLVIGWLYEVPLYLSRTQWYRAFLHSTYPFLISSRMFGMILFLVIVKELDWKFSYKTKIGLIIFTVFSIAWMFYFPLLLKRPFRLFLYRVPAMILMITFPLDIKGE